VPLRSESVSATPSRDALDDEQCFSWFREKLNLSLFASIAWIACIISEGRDHFNGCEWAWNVTLYTFVFDSISEQAKEAFSFALQKSQKEPGSDFCVFIWSWRTAPIFFSLNSDWNTHTLSLFNLYLSWVSARGLRSMAGCLGAFLVLVNRGSCVSFSILS
jgi:hypothetical protein